MNWSDADSKLIGAVYANRFATLQTLVREHGANVNVFCDVNMNTLLHYAAREGFAECVAQLCLLNANPFARNLRLQTPLEAAQEAKAFVCAQLLQSFATAHTIVSLSEK